MPIFRAPPLIAVPCMRQGRYGNDTNSKIAGGHIMADTRIQILAQGPIIIAGHADLIDDHGNTIPRQEPVALCRCGQSQAMPFCDGIEKGHMKTCARAKDIL